MSNKLYLIWYYIEVKISQLLNLFKIEKDSDIIPKGMYCYEPDYEKNKNKDDGDHSYYIKPCKYYRSTTNGIACTYIGYFGFDVCLYDQCKMCGENEDYE